MGSSPLAMPARIRRGLHKTYRESARKSSRVCGGEPHAF